MTNKLYSNRVMAERINDRIHSERDRKLLYRRLIDGVTYEKLAEEFDLSTRQVKNIFYRSKSDLLPDGT